MFGNYLRSRGSWSGGRCARVEDATETLEARIEDENVNEMAEAVEVRETLERVQALSLEVSEKLDAYQERHAP